AVRLGTSDLIRSHVRTLTPPSISALFFFLLIPPPPRSTLFPYTTLFRSLLCLFAIFLAISTALSGQSPSTRQPSVAAGWRVEGEDRKSTRLNSSHVKISYAVFCLKKKSSNGLEQCNDYRCHAVLCRVVNA